MPKRLPSVFSRSFSCFSFYVPFPSTRDQPCLAIQKARVSRVPRGRRSTASKLGSTAQSISKPLVCGKWRASAYALEHGYAPNTFCWRAHNEGLWALRTSDHSSECVLHATCVRTSRRLCTHVTPSVHVGVL